MGKPAVRKPAAAQPSAETIDKIVTRTPEQIISSFAAAKVTVTKKFDEVTNELVARVGELAEVQDCIVAARSQLEEHHAIQVAAGKLQSLMDEEAELRQQRDREEEEYQYKLKQTRKAADDRWADDVVKRSAAFEASLALKTNALVARETTLKAAEQELAVLRAEVTAHPKVLADAVARENGVVTNRVTKDLEHKHAIASMEQTTALKLAVAEGVNLGKRVAELAGQVESLQGQVNAANARAQTVAEKAIEGASKQQVVVNTSAGESTTGKRG